jgi:vanillate O-demethylase monooxygenase subunit
MFVRNAWYVGAWADEVDSIMARRICGDAIVFFRHEGVVVALQDRCVHRAAPLRLGKLVPEGIQCGYHGLVFNGSGRCVHIPVQEQIPSRAAVRAYPVVEKDAMVWIWMGDPAAADPGLIPDFPYHDDNEKWPFKGTVFHIKANYQLIADNLMDMTHLAYVHVTTLGGVSPLHTKAETRVENTPRGVHYVRWMTGMTPSPTFQKALAFKGTIDRWQDFEFIAPGAIVQHSGAVDAGMGGFDKERPAGGFQVRLFHGMTPETETTSHYFWSVANRYRPYDATATETVFNDAYRAFKEDQIILEAEQEAISDMGEAGLLDIASDRSRRQMRRAVQDMLDAEQSPAPALHEIASTA